MDKSWLELITRQLYSIDLNKNKTTKIRKIKVKNEDDEYQSLIKKYNIKDYAVDKMDENDRKYEMNLIDWNLNVIESYENSYNATERELNEFISFNLAKVLQYKIKFCFDLDNKMYQDLSKIQKNKLRIIGKKIYNGIPLLKNKGIRKKNKIHHIKKLNRALKHFLTDCEDSESQNIDQIIYKMKKIKIKYT